MPHALQQRLEEAEGVGIDVPHADDAVAGSDEGEHRDEIAAMPLAKPMRVLGAFERGELLLEHRTVGLRPRE